MTPMPVDWDSGRVQEYLTAEANQKTKEQFYDTHIDIDKIRYEWLWGDHDDPEFVTQEEFRDAVLDSAIDAPAYNRIFIVRGETGSGKSQLCQWLEYEVGSTPGEGISEDHIALRVSRGNTNPEDIIEILTAPLDEEISVANIDELPEEKVAHALVSNVEGFAYQSESYTEELEALATERLEKLLVENLREYKEAMADPDKDIPDLLTRDQYRTLAFEAFNEARGGDTIYPELLSDLHEQLSDRIGIGDFQQHLKNVSEYYEERGIRPVLICEDVVTFNVLKEQLLDEIFELKNGQYDIVLGWTTGFERDGLEQAVQPTTDIDTYMQERAEGGYLSMTDDTTGQAYFLTEDVTVELVRKYTQVIREKSDTQPERAIEEDAFDGLYPFNAAFVERAYENLHDPETGQKRRTPRLLLIRVISECLQSYDPPFQSIEDNNFIMDQVPDLDLGYPDELRYLYKWYGIARPEGKWGVKRGIFETFDIEVPAEAEERDGWVLLGQATVESLHLRHEQGTLEPGAPITLEARLANYPEEGVVVTRDGIHEDVTDSDGLAEVTLPGEGELEEDGSVVYHAEKEELTATLELEPGSLQIEADPVRPEQGEEVALTVKLNGQPAADAVVTMDGEELGTTGQAGKITCRAPSASSAEFEAAYADKTASITIPIESGTRVPVETELSSDEVNKRQVEFENWLKVGEEFPSSKTLRDGTVAVLERWHDPTRLANPNATTTGTAGIYFAQGNSVQVSVLGADERQSLSVELPHGNEYANIYEPLFWAGISDAGGLPDWDDLNYDLLRAWADEQAAQFRRKMREEIEEYALRGELTIEEFVILSQFILLNGKNGTTELSRELVFKPFEKNVESAANHPLRKQFDHTDELYQAYDSLTKSSSIPEELAKGFFLLKENVLDVDRFEAAYEAVEANLESYLQQAMTLEYERLPQAYLVSRTHNSGSYGQLDVFIKRVRDYVQALEGLDPERDGAHILEAIESIDAWYDPDQTVEELRDSYTKLYEVTAELDAGTKSDWNDWERVKTQLEAHPGELDLDAFQDDVEQFRDIENQYGVELVGTIHDFERSRKERPEWDVYEAIAEMVAAAKAVELPERDTLKTRVRDLDELDTYEGYAHLIEELTGGTL